MTRYLSAANVHEINQMILAAESAQGLLRDRAALESAIARPQQHAYYQQSDLAEQAVALVLGIALNHPFVDANKRTAAIAGDAFLRLNGFYLEPDTPTKYGELILRAVIAEGAGRARAVSQLSHWVHDHMRPLSSD